MARSWQGAASFQRPSPASTAPRVPQASASDGLSCAARWYASAASSKSSKSFEAHAVVVEEIGGCGPFQPDRVPKRCDRLLVARLLLQPASQKVIATSRWRLLQQFLEANDCIRSSARDLEQTPRALELNVRIIWSDAENSLIGVGSSPIAVQAEEQVGHSGVKLESRVGPDHHRGVYRRDVASRPRLCSSSRVAAGTHLRSIPLRSRPSARRRALMNDLLSWTTFFALRIMRTC